MIIPDVPFIDESNNRYFDGPFGNDTMILEFNKEQIDLENAYADNPPIIANKQDENIGTSIEVGQGQIDTIKSTDEAQKDMHFNVTVMGRHKISSKEYKNGMKSQKNQSMSDISVFGQSDEVSQNPMFNQQRLNNQGENRSSQQLCPYFNKPQPINRPQTAFNLNQQIKRNLNSNSAASMRVTPGRPKTRGALLKPINSQVRNILSNNIIDLNIQLVQEHPPHLQQQLDKIQTNFQQRVLSVPVKGSRPKTAAELNSTFSNIYQNQFYSDVSCVQRLLQALPLSSCNSRDQRSQLSKSFRALSKRGEPQKQTSIQRQKQPPQENSTSNHPYHLTEKHDCPQFFAKQLKLEENSPQIRKQMHVKQYKTAVAQSKINKLRQFHLNSYLNQVVQSSESHQQQTTLEVNNEGTSPDQKAGAACEGRGFMQVVIPIVQNNGVDIAGEDNRGYIYGSNNISNRKSSSHGRGTHQRNSNRRQSKIDMHNTIDSKDGIQIQI